MQKQSEKRMKTGVMEQKIRTAAYIRVSTNLTDQENSYELQETYFQQFIGTHSNWAFAGIYSDYGISGTSSERRIGFQRLLRHCREGKIDQILCKSISRFARNTADFMKTLQLLKECNVTILFEKENLNTADTASEFILTTLGAIAQEESRSISRNISIGNDMRFQRGDVRNIELYGYRYTNRMLMGESGYRYREIEIVPEEAMIVQRIFREVSEGSTYIEIARGLNAEHIKAPDSTIARKRRILSKKGQLNSDLEDGWTAERISSLVHNERYAGDVLVQKTYTADYLNHIVRKNKGELKQYYVRNHHLAIIDREEFEEVQRLIHLKVPFKERGEKSFRAFSKRLICGECGRFYNVRNTRNYPIWFCPSTAKHNGRLICHAQKVYEEQIEKVILKAIIERFHLTIRSMREDITVEDIMNEKADGKKEWFSMKADSFVEQMQRRMEKFQQMDFIEKDRNFYKKQIAAISAQIDHLRKKQILLAYQKDEILQKQLTQAKEEKDRLAKHMNDLEDYWEELENNYEARKNALDWLVSLPKGREGTRIFLKELTGEHSKAFVLSVTIFSPCCYTVHWFDDTRTKVLMESNIEDRREMKESGGSF